MPWYKYLNCAHDRKLLEGSNVVFAILSLEVSVHLVLVWNGIPSFISSDSNLICTFPNHPASCTNAE